MNKFFAGIFLTLTIFVFTACGNSETSNQNFSATLKNTFQVIGGVKSDLSQAAENLSANDSENTSANLKQIFDISKEKISAENAKLTTAEVPENFSASNQKILECLKIEYNLMDRLKENLSVQNEYEAADNFSKSKELFTNLKEQSALLNVDGNNFEEVFDLSTVCQKIENYLNTRKQLRFDRDNATAQAAQVKQNIAPPVANNNGVYVGSYNDGTPVYILPETITRNYYGSQFTFTCAVRAGNDMLHYVFEGDDNLDDMATTYRNNEGYRGGVYTSNSPVARSIYEFIRR